MPTKYLNVGGTAVQYYHAGKTTLPDVAPDLSVGEILLFVHGAGSNGSRWQDQVSGLSRTHSPVAFDFPGHGRSAGIESLGSIATYSTFLQSFTSTLHLRPAVVVGHAMGGAIALDYAARNPQLVRALVLVATGMRFAIAESTLSCWRDVMAGRAQQPFNTEAFSPSTDFAIVRASWGEQIKTDPRVRYFDLLACQHFDAAALLQRITMPTLLIAGRDDALLPFEQVTALHRGIRDSQVVVMENAGHDVISERSDAFTSCLRDFLSRLEAS